MEERSLPPHHHIINSYLTRTICVQAAELRHSETGGGGEQWRGRRRDLCSWLTKSFFFFSTIQTNLRPEIWNDRSGVAHRAFATLCCTFSRLVSLILHQRPTRRRHFSCHGGWWVKCFVIVCASTFIFSLDVARARSIGVSWHHVSSHVNLRWAMWRHHDACRAASSLRKQSY